MTLHRKLQRLWDSAHCMRQLNLLSGHSLQTHLADLRLSEPLLDPILCVGVGNGGWVRELERTHDVSSLDVAARAAQRVTGPFYNEYNLLPSDRFGTILCLWVFPHTPWEQLAVQLPQLIRSLQPTGGVLAMHYHEPLSGEVRDGEGHALEGRITVSREKMTDLIVAYGGRPVLVRQEDSAEHDIRAVTLHVGRTR